MPVPWIADLRVLTLKENADEAADPACQVDHVLMAPPWNQQFKIPGDMQVRQPGFGMIFVCVRACVCVDTVKYRKITWLVLEKECIPLYILQPLFSCEMLLFWGVTSPPVISNLR